LTRLKPQSQKRATSSTFDPWSVCPATGSDRLHLLRFEHSAHALASARTTLLWIATTGSPTSSSIPYLTRSCPSIAACRASKPRSRSPTPAMLPTPHPLLRPRQTPHKSPTPPPRLRSIKRGMFSTRHRNLHRIPSNHLPLSCSEGPWMMSTIRQATP